MRENFGCQSTWVVVLDIIFKLQCGWRKVPTAFYFIYIWPPSHQISFKYTTTGLQNTLRKKLSSSSESFLSKSSHYSDRQHVQQNDLSKLPYVSLSAEWPRLKFPERQSTLTLNSPEKSTWRGCGLHIPTVMNAVSKDQWCTCVPKTTVGDDEFPPKIGQGQPPK